MRMARIKIVGESAVYHCLSRVVGDQMLLGDLGKERLAELLAKMVKFYGKRGFLTGLAQEGLKLGGKIDPDIRDKAVLDPAAIKAELARGGELSLGQVLRLRVRHLTDGVFLGSKEFVDEMFARHRDRFSAKRKDGARPIHGVPLPEIRVMRDLRVDAIA